MSRNTKTAALKKRKKFTRDDLELVSISLPSVIWYIVFAYLPLVGIVVAFKHYTLKQGAGFFTSLFSSPWVGLDNFKFLFARDDIGMILTRTVGYNIVFIILDIVIPVTLAIMLSMLLSKKLSKATQTASFLPHFMSWVVASYFVYAFLSSEYGLVTKIIENGGSSYNFYGADANAIWPFLLIFLHVWKTAGYNMVVYLATITAIDNTYYEAAVIDGATKWQQVKKITLPMLKPIIIIMAIMAFGKIISSDFGLFFQATKNSVALYPSTLTLDCFIFNALTKMNNLGMSSAAAFFQSFVGFIMIMVANSIVKKIDEESSFF